MVKKPFTSRRHADPEPPPEPVVVPPEPAPPSLPVGREGPAGPGVLAGSVLPPVSRTPPVFQAPMADDRKRYLLSHIGHVSSDAETWSADVCDLVDAGLVRVSGDMMVLTGAGREALGQL